MKIKDGPQAKKKGKPLNKLDSDCTITPTNEGTRKSVEGGLM